MPEISRASDPTNMIWKLIDRETGAENGAISWAVRVGERFKIRLINEMESDHPMHHPFHIHGAGQTVDITNPGLWIAYCHIAEHTESGMMFSFQVSSTWRDDELCTKETSHQ